MYANDGPKGCFVAEVFGNSATKEYAQAHAKVPTGEQSGVGCAALVVAGHADDHVLEGRPHVTVAQTDEQSRSVIAKLVGH